MGEINNTPRKPRVFISGKVTDLPRKEVVKKFKTAQLTLEKAGAEVVNPVNLIDKNTSWQDAMRICIIHLCTCDAIYMLEDWKESKGSIIENKVAKLMGIDIL